MNDTALNERFNEEKNSSNVLGGIIGATIGAILGVAIWALVAIITEYNIGYIAIAVGFLVGYLARKMVRVPHLMVTLYACAISIVAILIGKAITLIVYAAQLEEIGFFEILPFIDFPVLFEIMFSEMGFKDLLFMGIATYTAFNINHKNHQNTNEIPSMPPSEDHA